MWWAAEVQGNNIYDEDRSHVGYLHHFVRDFLDLPKAQKLLYSRTNRPFNPSEGCFTSFVLQLKYAYEPTSHRRLLEVSGAVGNALLFTRRAMETTGNSYVHFLDELDRTVMDIWLKVSRKIRIRQGELLNLRMDSAHWANSLTFHQPTDAATRINRDNFLGLAVSYGLTKYVEAKLAEDLGVLSAKRGPLLLEYIFFLERPVDTAMVSVLFRNGANPNEEFCGCTIWQYALELIESLRKPSFTNDVAAISSISLLNLDRGVLSSIFKLLVQGGAHPNVCTHIKNIRGQQQENLLPQAQYIAYFSTPAKIFSPGGLFVDAGLAELIKSRGGIEFLESVQLQSTDWDDAQGEALTRYSTLRRSEYRAWSTVVDTEGSPE